MTVTHTPGTKGFGFLRLNSGLSQYQTDFHIVVTSLANGPQAIDLTQSYECVGSYVCASNPPAADTRYFAAGSEVSIPEPASTALLGLGVAGVGMASSRRCQDARAAH